MVVLKKSAEVSSPREFNVKDSKIDIVNFTFAPSQVSLKGYVQIFSRAAIFCKPSSQGQKNVS